MSKSTDKTSMTEIWGNWPTEMGSVVMCSQKSGGRKTSSFLAPFILVYKERVGNNVWDERRDEKNGKPKAIMICREMLVLVNVTYFQLTSI